MVLSYVNVRVDPVVFLIFPEILKRRLLPLCTQKETSLRFWQSTKDQISQKRTVLATLTMVVME
jgi:hypothetical protein